MNSISSTYVVIVEPIAHITLEIWRESCTSIRIESLKNAMFGPAQFSVYVFTHSIEETPFRGLRWITGRKNSLKRLVRSNINPIYRLDAKTKESTRFRIPTALSCSVPRAARTLLRAALLLSASDVYENLYTDHTPSLPVPPIP